MHSDPEIIAMMALGEPDIPEHAMAHVTSCPECYEELESLRRVATIARSGSPLDDRLEPPNPAVWNRISMSLGLDPAVVPTTVSSIGSLATEVAPDPVPLRRSRAHVGRRTRARRWIAASAVAAVVVGAGVAGVAIIRAQGLSATVTTQATLKALPDWTGSRGEALVEKVSGGQREVVVSMSMSRGASGYREVWLISPDLKKLISIGVLSGTKGNFILPPDVNLKDYPIVDVSEEPLDGNPAHSGNSIVRGTLDIRKSSLT